MLSSISSPLVITSPRIVVDTNVLLVSVSSRSRHHTIYRSFLDSQYTLCVTTDIIDEYEEILGKPEHLGPQITQFVMETIDNAANVVFVTRYYRWELIETDHDARYVGP